MLDESDLKVDVYRSTGPEGAGNWALRLTHVPSGVHVTTEGDFAAGEDPEPAIVRARADLSAQLDAKLQGG